MVAGPRGVSGPADWLNLVLDTLLPANDEIPPAGQMGLTESILLDAQWIPELDEALRWLSDEIPATFASASAHERTAVLTELEAVKPRLFGGVVNLAYNAYYTDPRVLALIERKSGFTATPPQPLGYEIEPFDPGVLATIKDRQPLWRRS